jgi:hypothetical protein
LSSSAAIFDWSKCRSWICGCFGGGGVQKGASAQYPWEIARDVGLLALSLFLVWLRRTRLALDNLLFPPRTAGEDLALDEDLDEDHDEDLEDDLEEDLDADLDPETDPHRSGV